MGDNEMVTPQSLDLATEDPAAHAFTSSQIDALGNKDPNGSDSRPESPSADSPDADESTTKSTAPLQKRRRVTRACDECRRKKIKCDGKQPCTHCTVYSYECTYDQPSNRRRNPAPQYIEALESRLQKAEAVLRSVLPTLDLDDPKFDAQSIQQLVESARSNTRPDAKTAASAAPETTKPDDDAQLQSMVDRTGALDIDDTGNWDFHGHSSGYVFMRRFRAQFGDQLLPDFKSAKQKRTISQVLESPRSAQSSPYDFNLPAAVDLPPREVAIELCCNTLDDCCALMRPVHRPTFFKRLHKLYDTEPEQYNNEHVQFLPLLYVVMAVGCLFSKAENDYTTLDIKGYKEATEQGYQYFNSAKQMLDITDCRDLVSLQAVLFMILFLQSTAKLPTCYAYIGVALRVCCRLGLHRIVPHKFNPIELEERKRAFWLVRKMDSYVGAVLGLPQMLSDDDVDQEFPTEVDDEYITSEGIQPMPAGIFPLVKATNASTRLTHTLRKVVRFIYPIKGLDSPQADQRYTISHRRIRELERDLQTWMDELPMELRPSENATRELARVQQLLRISYAHVQMMIYRPFLHYVSQACQNKNVDKRSFACAAACISVSRNIVHITSEMKRRGLLVGSYWFVMYTTYFAILSLVFFVIENPNSPTGQDILKDAVEGRETLASLAKRSMAADRCTLSLSGLFDALPTKLQERRSSSKPIPSTSRKRPPPSSTESNQEKQQTSGIPTPISLREPSGPPARARTFPSDFLAKIAKRNSMPEAPAAAAFIDGVAPQPPLVGFGSPSTASPISPNFDYTPQMTNAQIPDLKNVMFPSDNPFAYPNQPISTLESSDGQYSFQESGMDAFAGANDHHMYDTPTTNVSSMPQSAAGPSYDFSYQRAVNDHPGLMQGYGGNASQFGTPLTDLVMQNAFGAENSPHFNHNHMPNLHDPMTTTTNELSDNPSAPGSQNSEGYWTRLHKNDVGMRTGLTPGTEPGLNEFFNPDSWGTNWSGQHYPNPQ